MASASSASFWSLIDRWHLSDEQAFELVGYEGKLPTTAKRPRFKLSPDQRRIVATLLEIENALAAAGIGTEWLSRKDKGTGRTPLDLLRAGAMDDVLPLITAATLRASVRKPPATRRSQ
jgi:hypothetical protein